MLMVDLNLFRLNNYIHIRGRMSLRGEGCNTPYLITCISHCYMCWSICIDPKLGIYEFKYEY